MKYSRRGLFSLLARPLQSQAAAAKSVLTSMSSPPPARNDSPAPVDAPGTKVAIIQGRHCLALTSFCSVCVERCPVPGAMKFDRGLPMVVGDLCTGCAICHDVCPAPTNAILMLPRRRPVPPPSSPA